MLRRVAFVRSKVWRYIPEDGILHGHRLENLKSYIALTGWALKQRRYVSSVKYQLGFYIPGDSILHSHCLENLRSYRDKLMTFAYNIVACRPVVRRR
jgi:hypothetical protein